MLPRVRHARLVLDVVALGLIALYVTTIVVRNAGGQWDLQTLVAAANVALAGMDPYDPRNLFGFSPRATHPFLYPPIGLALLLPLAMLPPAITGVVWIVSKAGLLAIIVFVARRWFLPRAEWLPIALIAVFGWNGSAIWDLRSGNVALVEAALLWIAFACFVQGRRTSFAALVVLAACFKLSPAAFLLLLLVPAGGQRPSPRLFVASLAALAVVVGGSSLWGWWAHWEPFLRHLPAAHTLGESNPSSLGFFITVAGATGWQEPVAVRVGTAAWACFTVSLLAVSLPVVREAWRRRDPRVWVMLAVFLEVLVAPRIMAYGFVLLAPAPLFWAPRPFTGPTGRLALALVLASQGLARAANLPVDAVPSAPFLLTLLVWLLVVSDVTRARNEREGLEARRSGDPSRHGVSAAYDAAGVPIRRTIGPTP